MNINHKVLFSGLMFVSFAVSAQNHGSSRAIPYHSGQTAPSELFTDNNMVGNYHHYHLVKPPSGYEWVRAENDQLLLVSSTSHVIRDVEYRPNISPEAKQ
jgi:Ni/Co efflux regulator RcnB